MSLNTRRPIQLIFLCLFFSFGLWSCQPKKEMITVGVLNYVPALDPSVDGFKERMTELGYIEGENITYLYDGPAENIEELPGLAKGLVESRVDIILALSTPATLAAKDVTAENQIPIVFAPVTDPEGSGVVENLSHPGGNITGVTNFGSDLRRMEWLLKLSPPETEQIYVPYNPLDSSAASALTTAQTAAEDLGVELILQPATTEEDMKAAVANIPEDADAIFMLPDGLAINLVDFFVAAADKNDLPFAGPTTVQVEKGALMSFGINLREVGRQVARLADQILRGVAPKDLPVEVGEFFLAINLKAAADIGLTISDEILNQASIICRAETSNPNSVDCR
jgi:putative ABC transport system substrate-binding protein